MKNLLKILYEYFANGKVEFKFIKEHNIDVSFGGIQLILLEYTVIPKTVFKLPYIIKKEIIYWKPFKNVLSEEALPSLTENNKKSKEPYVNVWFILNEKINKGDLYSVQIDKKVKLNSSLTYILNFLVQKIKK